MADSDSPFWNPSSSADNSSIENYVRTNVTQKQEVTAQGSSPFWNPNSTAQQASPVLPAKPVSVVNWQNASKPETETEEEPKWGSVTLGKRLYYDPLTNSMTTNKTDVPLYRNLKTYDFSLEPGTDIVEAVYDRLTDAAVKGEEINLDITKFNLKKGLKYNDSIYYDPDNQEITNENKDTFIPLFTEGQYGVTGTGVAGQSVDIPYLTFSPSVTSSRAKWTPGVQQFFAQVKSKVEESKNMQEEYRMGAARERRVLDLYENMTPEERVRAGMERASKGDEGVQVWLEGNVPAVIGEKGTGQGTPDIWARSIIGGMDIKSPAVGRAAVFVADVMKVLTNAVGMLGPGGWFVKSFITSIADLSNPGRTESLYSRRTEDLRLTHAWQDLKDASVATYKHLFAPISKQDDYDLQLQYRENGIRDDKPAWDLMQKAVNLQYESVKSFSSGNSEDAINKMVESYKMQRVAESYMGRDVTYNYTFSVDPNLRDKFDRARALSELQLGRPLNRTETQNLMDRYCDPEIELWGQMVIDPLNLTDFIPAEPIIKGISKVVPKIAPWAGKVAVDAAKLILKDSDDTAVIAKNARTLFQSVQDIGKWSDIEVEDFVHEVVKGTKKPLLDSTDAQRMLRSLTQNNVSKATQGMSLGYITPIGTFGGMSLTDVLYGGVLSGFGGAVRGLGDLALKIPGVEKGWKKFTNQILYDFLHNLLTLATGSRGWQVNFSASDISGGITHAMTNEVEGERMWSEVGVLEGKLSETLPEMKGRTLDELQHKVPYGVGTRARHFLKRAELLTRAIDPKVTNWGTIFHDVFQSLLNADAAKIRAKYVGEKLDKLIEKSYPGGLAAMVEKSNVATKDDLLIKNLMGEDTVWDEDLLKKMEATSLVNQNLKAMTPQVVGRRLVENNLQAMKDKFLNDYAMELARKNLLDVRSGARLSSEMAKKFQEAYLSRHRAWEGATVLEDSFFGWLGRERISKEILKAGEDVIEESKNLVKVEDWAGYLKDHYEKFLDSLPPSLRFSLDYKTMSPAIASKFAEDALRKARTMRGAGLVSWRRGLDSVNKVQRWFMSHWITATLLRPPSWIINNAITSTAQFMFGYGLKRGTISSLLKDLPSMVKELGITPNELQSMYVVVGENEAFVPYEIMGKGLLACVDFFRQHVAERVTPFNPKKLGVWGTLLYPFKAGYQLLGTWQQTMRDTNRVLESSLRIRSYYRYKRANITQALPKAIQESKRIIDDTFESVGLAKEEAQKFYDFAEKLVRSWFGDPDRFRRAATLADAGLGEPDASTWVSLDMYNTFSGMDDVQGFVGGIMDDFRSFLSTKMQKEGTNLPTAQDIDDFFNLEEENLKLAYETSNPAPGGEVWANFMGENGVDVDPRALEDYSEELTQLREQLIQLGHLPDGDALEDFIIKASKYFDFDRGDSMEEVMDKITTAANKGYHIPTDEYADAVKRAQASAAERVEKPVGQKGLKYEETGRGERVVLNTLQAGLNEAEYEGRPINIGTEKNKIMVSMADVNRQALRMYDDLGSLTESLAGDVARLLSGAVGEGMRYKSSWRRYYELQGASIILLMEDRDKVGEIIRAGKSLPRMTVGDMLKAIGLEFKFSELGEIEKVTIAGTWEFDDPYKILSLQEKLKGYVKAIVGRNWVSDAELQAKFPVPRGSTLNALSDLSHKDWMDLVLHPSEFASAEQYTKTYTELFRETRRKFKTFKELNDEIKAAPTVDRHRAILLEFGIPEVQPPGAKTIFHPTKSKTRLNEFVNRMLGTTYKGKDVIEDKQVYAAAETYAHITNYQNFDDYIGKKNGIEIAKREIRMRLAEDAVASGWGMESANRIATQTMVVLNNMDKTWQELYGDGTDSLWGTVIKGLRRDGHIESFLTKGPEGLKRGVTQVADDGRRIISSFNAQNPTTVLHEVFHAIRGEGMRAYMPQESIDVLNKYTEDLLGTKFADDIENHLEKQAMAFERYILDGVLPKSGDVEFDSDLERAFNFMKDVFLMIYTNVKKYFTVSTVNGDREITLTDEVRDVFDQVLGGWREGGKKTAFQQHIDTPRTARNVISSLIKAVSDPNTVGPHRIDELARRVDEVMVKFPQFRESRAEKELRSALREDFDRDKIVKALRKYRGEVERGMPPTFRVQYQPGVIYNNQAISQAAQEGVEEGSSEVLNIEPKKTIKGYKLFRTDPKRPGELFPLFVDSNTPVPIGEWVRAKPGPLTESGKVKSKLGELAYRPGWHSGTVPSANHIGGKSVPGLGKPDFRPDNQVWAEVEIPADVDWQSVATSRARTTKSGKIDAKTAHITDQVPLGGNYKYKTNPNMNGEWIISGEVKVLRVLDDSEVEKINKAAGISDLPRRVSPPPVFQTIIPTDPVSLDVYARTILPVLDDETRETAKLSYYTPKSLEETVILLGKLRDGEMIDVAEKSPDFLQSVDNLPSFAFDEANNKIYMVPVEDAPQEFLDAVDEARRAEGVRANHVEQFQTNSDNWYYSTLEARLESMNRVRPNQVIATNQLMNNLLGSGVKKEELKWVGLQEWIGDRKSVNLQEALDYVQAHKVTIKERVLGGGKSNFYDQLSVSHINQTQTGWDVFFKDGNVYHEADEAHIKRAWDIKNNAIKELNSIASEEEPRYEQPGTTILPGDYTNYREFLFYSNKAKGFTSQHFGEMGRDLLANALVDDRVDVQGRKFLFLEEGQSDWHQAGQKVGYQQLDKRISKLPDGFEIRSEEDPTSVVGLTRFWVVDADGRQITAKGYNIEGTTNEAINYLNRPFDAGVSPAPYSGTGWMEMIMKRLIAYATDNGYDGVAWAPGELVAGKYGKALREAYSKIEWDGTIVRAWGKNGEEVLTKSYENLSPAQTQEQLIEDIGKGNTNRLLTKKATDEVASISGDEITIDESGFEIEYNKVFPNFANKYMKQWGEKVEKVEIKIPGIENQPLGVSIHEVKRGDTISYDVVEDRSGLIRGSFGDKQSAEELLNKIQFYHLTWEFPYIPITDALKELKPKHPLFQSIPLRAQKASMDDATIEQLQELEEQLRKKLFAGEEPNELVGQYMREDRRWNQLPRGSDERHWAQATTMIHRMANGMDGLTGLRGQTRFYMDYGAMMKTAPEGDKTLSVAFIDLNHLKKINDRMNHTNGDDYIRMFAERLQEIFGEEYTYRRGGDEFIILMPPNMREEMEDKLRLFKESIGDLAFPFDDNGMTRAMKFSYSVGSGGTAEEAESLMMEQKRLYHFLHPNLPLQDYNPNSMATASNGIDQFQNAIGTDNELQHEFMNAYLMSSDFGKDTKYDSVRNILGVYDFVNLSHLDVLDKLQDKVQYYTDAGQDTMAKQVDLIRRDLKYALEYNFHTNIAKDKWMPPPLTLRGEKENILTWTGRNWQFTGQQAASLNVLEELRKSFKIGASGGMIPEGVTDTHITAFRNWADALAKVQAELQDKLSHGGVFMGEVLQDAIGLTNKAMFDYTNFSTLDSAIRGFFPFWMYYSRAWAFMTEQLSLHPEFLNFYNKYVQYSKRKAYEKGMTTSSGEQLPSLRGYMPMPGTNLWFNPTAAFLFRYIFPFENEYEDQERAESNGLLRQVLQFLYSESRLRGFGVHPLIAMMANNAGMEDYPRQSAGYELARMVLPIGLIPPNVERWVMSQMRKIGTTNREYWSVRADWQDFMVERQLLYDTLEQVNGMTNDGDKLKVAKDIRALIANPDRANDPRWQEAVKKYEGDEYLRRIGGNLTGFYTKRVDENTLALFDLRNDLNFLKSSINNQVQAQLFELDRDATKRYENYIKHMYETPDGFLYNIYQRIRFVTNENGEELVGQDRLDKIASEYEKDVQEETYYNELDRIVSERDEALRDLPIGVSYNVTEQIWDNYFADRNELEKKFPDVVFSPRPYSSLKPEEVLYDDFREKWWRMLAETEPDWDLYSNETYAMYKQKHDIWVAGLPAMGRRLLPYFSGFISTQQAVVSKGQDLTSFPEKLIAETTPEGYEEWRKSRHSEYDAVENAWEKLYLEEYLLAMKEYTGAERLYMEREWPKTHTAPTTEQMVAWVQENYPNRWSDEELKEVIGDREVLTPDESFKKGESEEQRMNREIWDWMSWAAPGYGLSDLETYFILRQDESKGGFDPSHIDTWFDAGGDETAWSGQNYRDFASKFHEELKAAMGDPALGLHEPSTAELGEWLQASKLNDGMKEQAKQNFGENILSLNSEYYSLPYAAQKPWREQYPAEYKLVKAYQDWKKKSFAPANPLWAKYYSPRETETTTSSGSQWWTP